MQHDFRDQPSGEAAERFRTWLESETVDTLRRTYGNAEETKTAIFLFVNRAFEAPLPEGEIGALFGRCIVRAGFQERDEESAFAWLEHFGEVAGKVHRPAQHISLAVHGGAGVEPVHVEVLEGGRYRLLYSPGLVEGVAAGDEIELLDEAGTFRIIRRGGNLAVQVFSQEPVQPLRDELADQVRERLSGSLDGDIDRGMVFTIPLSTGFAAIEAFFDGFVRTHAGTEWSYGNVYDPDTGRPLGWWNGA